MLKSLLLNYPTGLYNIYPNYNYDEGETISGYTAYNNIYVTVSDVNNTGAYIDAAFAAGASTAPAAVTRTSSGTSTPRSSASTTSLSATPAAGSTSLTNLAR